MTTLLGAGAPRHDPGRVSPFWAYFGRFVRHPRRTWARLLVDPARLRYAFFAVLLVGVGYAAAVGGIALSGGTPSTPWLAIPREDYFRWEALFIAPVTLLCWVLAAGVVQLLSRLLHGSGTFEDTLALLGFAIALPTLVTLIPDAIRAALTTLGLQDRRAWEAAVAEPGTADWWFLWASMAAYVVGLLCLFPLAVGASQGLRRWPAVAVGLAGAALYQGVYVIFVR
jgi:hypothetical protein